MAALPRCLCLVLTLSMVGWRPSAAVATGSNDTRHWWDSKEELQLRRASRPCRDADACAGSRRAPHRYRQTLYSLLQARALARSAGDRPGLGAIALKLSRLYLHVWDFDSALTAAEEGRAAGASLIHPRFEARLLLQLARLHASLRDGKAETLFSSAIEAARARGDAAVEATGWALMGADRLARGEIAGAERALDEAFRLRLVYRRADIPLSYARLGALKFAQGDLDAAGRFTELALAGGSHAHSGLPWYALVHQRGQIRLARGDTPGALEDFRSAMALAAEWRREVPPAAANVESARRIFDTFIVTAVREAGRTGSRKWAEESFQAVESNRAASLRESLAMTDVWRKKIPAEYWEVLGQLRAEHGGPARNGQKDNPVAKCLKLNLSELEAHLGLGYIANKAENFHNHGSLIDFQKGLSTSEVLLSFYLGQEESYVWAVTRETITVHRLAPAAQIRSEVKEFRSAVRGRGVVGGGVVGGGEVVGGSRDAEDRGERFYRDLFGDLRPEETGKETWLLSVDDALFELPFAALVTERRGGHVKYLVQKHALQVIPGALLLSSVAGQPGHHGFFLGVGDPIYNMADPRWTGGVPENGLARLGWFADPNAGYVSRQLNRLVGSAHEIESSTRDWGSDSVLLEGAEARRDVFLKMEVRGPSVIHLATHVLAPARRRGESVIAFGLGSFREPEYLAPSEIAMLRVPGALVTLSGCASGMGEFRAGAGMLGLARRMEWSRWVMPAQCSRPGRK